MLGRAPSAEDFAAAGVPSTKLTELTVDVCRTGKNKWHLRGAACAPNWTDTRYVAEALPVLDLDWSAVCKSCAAQAPVPEAAHAVMTAVRTLNSVAKEVDYWRQRLTGPDRQWAWLDYARLIEHRPWARQGSAPDLVPELKGLRSWATVAAAVRARAAQLHEEFNDLVDELRSRMPSLDLAGVLLRASATVFDETDVAAVSEMIQRVGGWRSEDDKWPAWSEAVTVWSTGRRSGRSPEETLAHMQERLRRRVPHVHDLTALPDQPQVAVEDGDCVHTWARRAFHAHLNAATEQWHARLEIAFETLTGDLATESTPEWAVLIPHAPLTRKQDAPLSFLSQFPAIIGYRHVLGEDYSWGYREGSTYQWVGGWYSHPLRPTVLRVPEPAVEHARALAPNLQCAQLTGSATRDRALANELVRRAGLHPLPEDFRGRRSPSELVRAARAGREAAHPRGHYATNRPFAPGQPPRPRIGYEGGWTDWVARAALENGSWFVFGSDDLDLLACALAGESGPRTVQVSVELPAAVAVKGFGGTVDQVHVNRDGSHAYSALGPRPVLDQAKPNDPLIVGVAGRVTGLTDDQSALLLAPAAHRDPFPVPLTYLVSMTFVRD